MFKLRSWKALGKNVCHLELGRNELGIKFIGSNKFTNKMVIQIDILGTFMSNGILSHKESTFCCHVEALAGQMVGHGVLAKGE